MYPLFLIFFRNKYVTNNGVEEISGLIYRGARSYLQEQWKYLFKLLVIITMIGFVCVSFLICAIHTIALFFGFLYGAIITAIIGDIAMRISTSYNGRVVYAAHKSTNAAMNEAVTAGAITGWLVSWASLVCVGMIYLCGLFLGFNEMYLSLGLCLGTSFSSMICKLAGGIFTKGADIGADLVGKLELNLPEDDKQNPAVIADNVGDNVGDCAGMAMDLFESRILAIAALSTFIDHAIFILCIGILSSIVGVQRILSSKKEITAPGDVISSMYRGLMVSAMITFILTGMYLWSKFSITLLAPVTLGLTLNFLIMIITERYTDSKYQPVQKIIEAAKSGHGTNVIEGIAIGMQYPLLPILAISISIIICITCIDTYSLIFIPLGMLSQSGIIIAQDAYGPVTDNAGGIAEMNNLDEIRKTTDILDAAGNSTKAVTKGYSISAMIFSVLAFLNIFENILRNQFAIRSVKILDPMVFVGLLIGGMIMYLFTGLTLQAVRSAGSQVVEEIREQTKNISKSNFVPDYNRTIRLLTSYSMKATLFPLLALSILPAVFIFSYITIGVKSAVSLLIGMFIATVIVGLFIAMSMTTSGGAWDNAKKALEASGQKGSATHHAAVTGDTVGDPYKDTAGPAINPAIKLLTMISILLLVLTIPTPVIIKILPHYVI